MQYLSLVKAMEFLIKEIISCFMGEAASSGILILQVKQLKDLIIPSRIKIISLLHPAVKMANEFRVSQV
jgi:hypothetical protein